MLILPLHHRPTWRTLPWMTLLLVLANVVVHVGCTDGDEARYQRALSAYVDGPLVAIELPRYRDHLAASDPDRLAALEAAAGEAGVVPLVIALQHDTGFLASLAAGAVVRRDDPRHDQWQAARRQFDALWSQVFVERHAMRYGEFDPWRMASAMFLHADAGHLFGNLLFLAMVGMLVEGALGGWRYVLLYLLAGLGASMGSAALHLDETGLALGASGAIAGLMGAYAVLWGRRRVRFFWWFFVAFDYARAPALVLLPIWLGWEVWNAVFNADAGVGFDAHAGGLVCGALLALAAIRMGWRRTAFVEAADADAGDPSPGARDAVRSALAALDYQAARRAAEAWVAEMPGDVDALEARYRAWRTDAMAPGFHAAARALFAAPITSRPAADRLVRAWQDYLVACAGRPQLSPAGLIALSERLDSHGHAADAERILRALAQRMPALPGLAAAAWRHVLRRSEQGDPGTDARLRWIAERFDGQPEAGQARLRLALAVDRRPD